MSGETYFLGLIPKGHRVVDIVPGRSDKNRVLRKGNSGADVIISETIKQADCFQSFDVIIEKEIEVVQATSISLEIESRQKVFMDEKKAREILSEIQSVANKHGLWFSHTEERKPGLKMIRVNEISIKIDDEPRSRA